MNLGLVIREDAEHDPPCRDADSPPCCWREATWADFDPDIIAAVQAESAELESQRRDEDESYIEERRALRGIA